MPKHRTILFIAADGTLPDRLDDISNVTVADLRNDNLGVVCETVFNKIYANTSHHTASDHCNLYIVVKYHPMFIQLFSDWILLQHKLNPVWEDATAIKDGCHLVSLPDDEDNELPFFPIGSVKTIDRVLEYRHSSVFRIEEYDTGRTLIVCDKTDNR